MFQVSPLKKRVYYKYRNDGWIVKSGIKYGVDYILYSASPADTHSEYDVI